MRLRWLELARYGCFTDFRLDFGVADQSRPDFHVIFGPNESGKSTFFSAFLDLLFGIEKRSPYGFFHDYRSMRIAAGLEGARGAFDVARIKREGNSLLDPNDLPLPEGLLAAPLGHLDRASYSTMFSLDDDSLQSGGESILQSEGDLGRLLFSATSGLSDLSRRLDGVRQETDAFHRAGGRATELNRQKERLKTLKAQQLELDINSRRYGELRQHAEEAAGRHEAAKVARDEARHRLGQSQRLLQALPIWTELQDLDSDLAPLEGLPVPPAGWQEEALLLSQEAAAKAAQVLDAEKDVERFTELLKALDLDQEALAQSEAIERLKVYEGRFRSADDIPTREAERAALALQVESVQRQLGRLDAADPRDLLLPATTKGTLRALIETASGLQARLEDARREEERAADALARAEMALKQLGEPLELQELDRLLKRLRGQELTSRLEAAEERRRQVAAEIDERLRALRPWQGSLEELADLTVPGRGRIEDWRQRQAAQAKERHLIEKREAELTEERDRLRVDVDTAKCAIEVIGDEAAASSRRDRDQAWARHRAGLASAAEEKDREALAELILSADAFHHAMAQDDLLVAQRARQSAELARLRQASEALARTEASLTRTGEGRKSLDADAAGLRQEISAALEGLALPADLWPEDLAAWLERRDALLQGRQDLRNAEAAKAAAADLLKAARGELLAALRAAGAALGEDVGEAAPLARLLDRAEILVAEAQARATKLASALETVQARQEDMRDRKRALGDAAEAERRWREAWAAALAECWLGAAEGTREVAAVREILEGLDALPQLIEKQDDLSRRIDAMAEDRARFVAAVSALAEELGLAFEATRVLEANDLLQQRLLAARQKAERQQALTESLAEAEERLRTARSALAGIDHRRSEMCALLGGETFSELLAQLKLAADKAVLTARRKARARELVTLLLSPSLEEAGALCRAADAATLQAEVVALESNLEAEEEVATQLYHEYRTAEAAIEAVGGDGRVARLEEERRTLLLEIEEQAEGYLRLKVGVLAAERALQIYRDRHRSAMMTRAGEAFAAITGGRFAKLTTVPGKNGEVLVGIRANGASLLASEMSKGSCFQLYLALRIAGYHEYATHHEALPFVADDIMETFDDDRSAESFRLLAAMAEKGQVIYLTHHAHMRDMAHKVCGKAVMLHELPASFEG